jgi:hypothetical protein
MKFDIGLGASHMPQKYIVLVIQCIDVTILFGQAQLRQFSSRAFSPQPKLALSMFQIGTPVAHY